MSNLSLFDDAFNEPFEPFFRRFLTPQRTEVDGNILQIRFELDVEVQDKTDIVRADIPGA